MTATVFLAQGLNGLQTGLMLFLVASGLSLVFGIMRFLNLAHGTLYMAGAYVAAAATSGGWPYGLAVAAAAVASFAIGVGLEVTTFRALYRADHLDQALLTFGLILVGNEAARLIFGPEAQATAIPASLQRSVEILPGLHYPLLRLVIIAAGALAFVALDQIVRRTRFGAMVRAGAGNPDILAALGGNVTRLFTWVTGIAALLAGLSGALVSPLLSVEPGMGEPMLILALVVIIVGGVGSITGSFVCALGVGLIDTLGRTLVPALLDVVLPPAAAGLAGPAVASVLIYVLLVVTLAVRPLGLFGRAP